MHIELKPIDSIRPYQKNPRINDGAVEAVARSLTEFGWRQPIVVDAEHIIVVGHTRWKAAKSLGMTEVPVHMAVDLTPEQAKAYRIADNQLATLADWDVELLPLELAELKDLGIDLAVLGWSPDDLAEVMAPPANVGLTDPDEVPAPPAQATTKPGDLWILGDHRLLCGDSSKPEDLDRLLNGSPIHLVNTDPPYNVKVEPRSNNAIAAGLSSFAPTQTHHQKFDVQRHPGKAKGTHKQLRAKDRPLANDFVSDSEFDRLLAAWFGNIARVLIPGGGFYIWGGYANCGNYPPALKASGLYFAQAIIWDKQHPVLTRKDFMGAHEWCFYGWKEGAAHRFFGPNNVPDLWAVKKLHSSRMVHLTEKPVELAARAMAYSSKPGENVLDLFGGSGSTLVAAEQQGRRAFLMELDGLYCDVIVERWEKFTGNKAERAR
ncbi:MAG TPA: DNA modification methylase [Phycisphaerales bacterium]|nr:DNA modification methylase [Phycisphaerales bacterium]